MASLRLAVDAMGGDFGLRSTVPASVLALNENSDLHITLVGDRTAIAEALRSQSYDSSRLDILHAKDSVAMDEKPAVALRQKRESSMAIALGLLRDGDVSAVVSAGNTGALVAMGCIIVERMNNVRRPAMCAPIPSDNGHTYMLDLGANTECVARDLAQFAVMGSALARVIDGRAAPRVGVLNIGAELIKGTPVVREAGDLIAANPHLNYIGFVEGGDIFGDGVDVVVCDGFVGNVALKVSEGVASFIRRRLQAQLSASVMGAVLGMLLKPVLRRMQRANDPRRYNGAVLLGLKGLVVKGHGGSDVQSFLTTLRQAARAVSVDLSRQIAAELAEENPPTPVAQ
ncbi:phosphate acyltransferase PlsX [Spongiibacter sp. KMU-166]|uniref:Phosphate acyltransferase n=1 Tax=Spongiibacter thalassae TaxID=2721624 RepID=A0ABX1GFJ8_9GAMM|nr:phosphate acyltransferase PlsX [Spongiibacter thalassae]